MCNVVENVSFEDFKLKNKDSSAKKFEEMSYLLFCSEFNQKKGIFRYKNHPGLETNPIKVEHMKNGVNYQICYGFQAKFCESDDNSKLIERIKKSIKTAIENHPELDKIYLYTNKEISASSEKGKLKPKYQEKVENFAREELKKKQEKLKVENKDIGIGSEVVEWYGPSYFEKILREEKNRYIYDIFFNVEPNMTDIIDEAKKHNERILSGIKTEIPFNDEKIEIPRDKIIKEINSYIDTQKHIIISGKSGSGKTAIIKEFYNKNELYSKSLQENEKSIPICVFRADEFDISHENDLSYLKNGLRDGFSFENFLKIYEDEKKKVVIIDSAERIFELKKEVFLDIIQELNKNGWVIIFTIQDFCVNDLKDILKERNLLDKNCENIQVELLELNELKEIKDRYNIKFPENQNIIEVLKNLFYLNLYMECYSDDIKNIDLDGFYKSIWKKCIQGKKRGKEFIKLVLERCNENRFYIKDDGVDKNILLDLEKNGIITYYDDKDKDGYFITHDIYEELALKRHISNSYENKRNTLFVEIGNSIRMKREFRLWLSNKIINQFNDDLDEFIKENFQNKELEDEWKDEIIISVLSSNYSKKFFDYFENEIKENNFKMLKHMLKLILRVECDKKCNENGWGEILSFVFKYEDQFFSDNFDLDETTLKNLEIYAYSGIELDFILLEEKIEKRELNLVKLKNCINFYNNFELILPVLEKWCNFNRKGKITEKIRELITDTVKDNRKNWMINSEYKFEKIKNIISFTYENEPREVKRIFNILKKLKILFIIEKSIPRINKEIEQIILKNQKIYKQQQQLYSKLEFLFIKNKNEYSVRQETYLIENLLRYNEINVLNELFNNTPESINNFIFYIICILYRGNTDIIEKISKLKLSNLDTEIFEKILINYIRYKLDYKKISIEIEKVMKEVEKEVIVLLSKLNIHDILNNSDVTMLEVIYLTILNQNILEKLKIEKKVIENLKKYFLLKLEKGYTDISQLNLHFLEGKFLIERFKEKNILENLKKIFTSEISFNLEDIEQLDINDIAIIYQLIPYNIQKEIYLKIYEKTLPKIANKLLDYNDKNTSYIQILEKAAYFFLEKEKEEIDVFVNPFKKDTVDKKIIKEFLNSVINAQDKLNRNDKFWYIWNELHDKIKKINSHIPDYEEIIENYLLVNYNSSKWINLKKENLDFYGTKILKHLEKNPVIFLSIIKMLNLTVDKKIRDKGIFWISMVISQNSALILKYQGKIIESLNNFIQEYIKEYREEIKKDTNKKKRLIKILDFMIERGSNVAILLKDSIG